MTRAVSTHPGMQRWTTILDGRQLGQLRPSTGYPRNNSPPTPGSALPLCGALNANLPHPAAAAPSAASPPPGAKNPHASRPPSRPERSRTQLAHLDNPNAAAITALRTRIISRFTELEEERATIAAELDALATHVTALRPANIASISRTDDRASTFDTEQDPTVLVNPLAWTAAVLIAATACIALDFHLRLAPPLVPNPALTESELVKATGIPQPFRQGRTCPTGWLGSTHVSHAQDAQNPVGQGRRAMLDLPRSTSCRRNRR
jgi:hypothetical protein